MKNIRNKTKSKTKTNNKFNKKTKKQTKRKIQKGGKINRYTSSIIDKKIFNGKKIYTIEVKLNNTSLNSSLKVSPKVSSKAIPKSIPININDITVKFKKIIEALIKKINDMFKYYDTTNYTTNSKKSYNDILWKPTKHLFEKYGLDLPDGTIEEKNNNGNLINYLINLDGDDKFKINIELYETSFRLEIIDKKLSSTSHNSFAFSKDNDKKMYMYGVKANVQGVFVSGTVLNQSAMKIAKSMRIPELYIGDSAGIKCAGDNSIELNHFSLLRIINDQETFYQSTMKPGYFYFLKDITTEEEKQRLFREEKQKLLDKLQQTDIDLVKKYMKNIKKPENIIPTNCSELNCIIEKIVGSHPESKCSVKNLIKYESELLKYVAQPLLSNY